MPSHSFKILLPAPRTQLVKQLLPAFIECRGLPKRLDHLTVGRQGWFVIVPCKTSEKIVRKKITV